MVTQIRAPKIETSETRSSIGRWFKRVGDAVTLGEPLVEIETGIQTIEVTAPATGVLSGISLRDGQFVDGGMVLGTVAD